jgi:hypothetical protein
MSFWFDQVKPHLYLDNRFKSERTNIYGLLCKKKREEIKKRQNIQPFLSCRRPLRLFSPPGAGPIRRRSSPLSSSPVASLSLVFSPSRALWHLLAVELPRAQLPPALCPSMVAPCSALTPSIWSAGASPSLVLISSAARPLLLPWSPHPLLLLAGRVPPQP